MSKKFYAVHRETGEKWKPAQKLHFPVMYDTGYFAECKYYSYAGYSITPLDMSVWKIVWKRKDEA